MISVVSKTEKAVKVFGCLELLLSLLSLASTIVALIALTSAISESSSPPDKPNNGTLMKRGMREDQVVEIKKVLTFVGAIGIKLIYLTMLFFLTEAFLAVFLLRAVHYKNLKHLRIWLFAALVYTVLYVTDFISTLHALVLFEDFTITVGIFVKVPLLILGWRLYNDWSKNGQNLVNEI